MKKTKMLMAIGIICLAMAGLSMAEVFMSFWTEDTTITSQKVISIDGVPVEDYVCNQTINLNAGEIVIENHTIVYTGNNPAFNVNITNSNSFEGAHIQLRLNGNLVSNPVQLNRNVSYVLSIEYVAEPNLASGSHVFQVCISPTL